MRLFIAIDLDNEDYFRQMQEQIQDMQAMQATYPKIFHLTLKFLGETDKKEEIISALKQIKFKEFRLKTAKMGVFPNENYIRVVWLGLDDNKQLEKLQKDVEDVLEQFKFKKDYEDFIPHITLARIKFIKPDEKQEFMQLIKKIMIPEKEFEVNEFKLIKSELTKEGHVYGDVGVFK